jgi:hypothetical protein
VRKNYVVKMEGYDALIDEYITDEYVIRLAESKEAAVQTAIERFLKNEENVVKEDLEVLDVRETERVRI